LGLQRFDALITVQGTGYTEEKPPFVEVAVMEESNPASLVAEQ